MTMKIFALLLFVFIYYSGFSQFYFKLGESYGIKWNEKREWYFYNYNPQTNKTQFVFYSLGKGFNSQIAAGFQFKKNIATELDFFYHPLSEFRTTQSGVIPSYNHTLSGNSYLLSPSVMLCQNKLNGFIQLGFILGKCKVFKIDEYNNNGLNSEIDISTWYYYDGFAIGFRTAIGISYKFFKDKFSAFTELYLIDLNYAPKKGKLIEWNLNGKDNLPNINTSDKEIEFTDSVDEGNIDNNSPRKVQKEFYPFSSIGINIGLIYYPFKTNESKPPNENIR